MFEVAETGSRVSRREYDSQVPGLRVDLINAQYDLRNAGFSVIILIAGDDRHAANEVVDLLNEWMDARFIDTRVFLQQSSEEKERPRFWRYWRSIPAHGRVGVFFGAWAINSIARRTRGEIKKAVFEDSISHEKTFEKNLADNDVLVLKFWLHLPKKALKKRMQKEGKKKDKAWRLQKSDWDIYRYYDDFISLASHYIYETDTVDARWHIVETTDRRYRNLKVARTVLDAIESRLASKGGEHSLPEPGRPAISASILDSVDLSKKLEFDEYKPRLKGLQNQLGALTLKAREKGLSSVLVFEGWDAAGKGGVIRRLTRPMSARDYRIRPIMAPTDEELSHPHLWRFWRHIPGDGTMLIFDRSWYGRVLVERVEGFAKPADWQRAYTEINDFEEQLADHGMVVLKFWLHIDQEEQLRRFKLREKTPYKKYKITDEDYRNREKWDDYVAAVNAMVARTSTDFAPWHLVAANSKRSARVEVLEHVCSALERALRS